MAARRLQLPPIGTRAVALFADHKVGAVPIVAERSRLVGLVSLNDLAREAQREAGRKGRELTGQEVSATLAAVCAPRIERSLTAAA